MWKGWGECTVAATILLVLRGLFHSVQQPSFLSNSVNLVDLKDVDYLYKDDERFLSWSCPYAVIGVAGADMSGKGANSQAVGGDNKEQELWMTDMTPWRTGNKFITVAHLLGIGFCCKARVTLPGREAPPVRKEPFKAEMRRFDFSSAPDVGPEFANLHKELPVCTDPSHAALSGVRLYELNKLAKPFGSHEVLERCAQRVRLLGCEAGYVGPWMDASTCPSTAEGDRGSSKSNWTLHVHVRSGDIFEGHFNPLYGQPPLSFYLDVLKLGKWDKLVLITNAKDEIEFNPVFELLMEQSARGLLAIETIVYTEGRSLVQDMRLLLCADSVVVPQMSSLNDITLWHGRASQAFVPQFCDVEGIQSLVRFRPELEVWGLGWSNTSTYSVFEFWENTPEQQLEMLTYRNEKGLTRCRVIERTNDGKYPPEHHDGEQVLAEEDQQK